MTKKHVAYVDFYENRLGSMLLGWFYLEELTQKARVSYELRSKIIHVKKMHVTFGIDNLSNSFSTFFNVISDWSIAPEDLYETESLANKAFWSKLNLNSKDLIRHMFTL